MIKNEKTYFLISNASQYQNIVIKITTIILYSNMNWLSGGVSFIIYLKNQY